MTKSNIFVALVLASFAVFGFAAEGAKKDAPKAEAKKEAPKADAKKEEAAKK